MLASQELAILTKYVKNTDVNWEALLAVNYEHLIPRQSNIIDIGANQGIHSSLFLTKLECNSLIMFEPIPSLNEALAKRYGSDPRVTLHKSALGSARGIAKFFVKPSGAGGESGLRKKNSYADGRSDDIVEINVTVSRLDDIHVPQNIAYMKLDIEGGEIDCLAGAHNTIATRRPIISVEYGRNGYEAFGHSKTALWDFATEQRYTIFDLLGNQIDTPEEYDACVSRYYWDYMLIPAEAVPALGQQFTRLRRAVLPLPIRR